ncbi:MAG: hypothetical protein CMN32_00400 [Saprospirales bacterium]|nr:hypothetical protein [Saprospirales bacterium]
MASKFRYRLLFAWLFILLARSWECYSQEPVFTHYNERNGLSHNTITALYQDETGFIWVGTAEGLNRFDGNAFRVYRQVAGDSSSLSNSYIRCIFPDNEGSFWVGTQSGLNHYDPVRDCFTRHLNPDPTLREAKNYILGGTVDQKGRVWYGTYDGLYRLDTGTGKLDHWGEDHTAPEGINSNAVWEVLQDRHGNIWVGTSNGLCVAADAGQPEFFKYFPDAGQDGALRSTRVFDLMENSDGSIWLATRDGLASVSGRPEDLRFEHYFSTNSSQAGPSVNFIWRLAPSANGGLLLATYEGGMDEVSFAEGKPGAHFAHHRHNEKQPASLASDEVNCVLTDRNGMWWIGTAAGLDFRDPANTRFQLLRNYPEDPLSLRKSHVQALHIDRNGDLWVGTRGAGLQRLPAEKLATGEYEFESFPHNPADPHSLSHNDVFNISEDSHGYLWVSTYDGVNYLPLPLEGPPRFQRFTTADGLAHKYVNQVLQRQNGDYWIATYGRMNLLRFHPAQPGNMELAEYNMDLERDDALVNATTHSVTEDRFGQLWIGTFNGISKLLSEAGAGTFENYLHQPEVANSLSNNYVSQVFCDSKGRLWAATNSGLDFLEQTSASAPVSFHHFGMAQGFPGEAVQSIVEDKAGRLWLSTSGGLVCFDPEVALAGGDAVLAVFDYRDGLQGNLFSERAAVLHPQSGQLFFGGAKGLNIFRPDSLWQNPFAPKVVFTGFHLFNEAVLPGTGEENPLDSAITRLRHITLNHRQNVFGFSFAALSYSQPEKNRYAYRMMGFDERWHHLGHENAVSFTNLSPGDYRLEVKAANSAGLWNEVPAALDITILPPPWLTWWAMLLYGLAMAGALYGFYRSRLARRIRMVEQQARLEQARLEEREALRRQNAADFHDELGHRLTKVSLYLELAERQKENESLFSAYLQKIKKQTAGLSAGIRDLIWTLDPESDNLFDCAVRLQEFGESLFDGTETAFSCAGLSDRHRSVTLAPNQRKHLLLLFKEAMNNALKYAGASQCRLSLSTEEELLTVSLSDNGVGFDPAAQASGYGLGNMKARAEKIGGKLNIDSRPGRGTTISLRMQMPRMG